MNVFEDQYLSPSSGKRLAVDVNSDARFLNAESFLHEFGDDPVHGAETDMCESGKFPHGRQFQTVPQNSGTHFRNQLILQLAVNGYRAVFVYFELDFLHFRLSVHFCLLQIISLFT